MTAQFPIVGPTGPQGPAGPPGPISAGGSGIAKYANVGAASSGYTTPRIASLDLTTGVDMRALVWVPNFATGTAQDFVDKWTTSGNQRCWRFGVTTGGQLQVQFSKDGTSTAGQQISLTSALLIADLVGVYRAPIWLRAVVRSNDGTGKSSCTFYYGFDNSTWYQMDTITNATPGPFFASTTSVISAGSQGNGTSNVLQGWLEMVEIYDLSATIQARLDVRALASSTSDYSDTTGTSKTWTHGSGVSLLQAPITYLDTRERAILARDVVDVARLNLKAFGAIGDGIADDTAAFVAAFAALPWNGGDPMGGEVYVPKGNYRVTSTITVPKKIIVRGPAGPVTSRIVADAAFPANTPLVVLGDQIGTGNTVQHCRVENMALDCNSVAACAVMTTQIQEEAGLVNCILTNFTLYGFVVGGYFNAGVYTVGPTGGCQNWMSHGLNINSIAASALEGIRLETTSGRHTITDVTVNMHFGNRATTSGGSFTSPASGSYSLPVSSTSQYPSSGTIFADGQLITYTSIDATHFLGCTGGYSHTYVNSTPVGIAGTSALHATTNHTGVLLLRDFHHEGLENGVFMEGGNISIDGTAGHAFTRYWLHNGPANTGRWQIEGFSLAANSGGTNASPHAMFDEVSGILYGADAPNSINGIRDDWIAMPKLGSSPASPASPLGGAIFIQDNGAGKPQVCVKWPTGDVTVLATQP